MTGTSRGLWRPTPPAAPSHRCPGAGAYPILSFTWPLPYKDPAEKAWARAISEFARAPFGAGLPGALAGVMALATPAVLAIPISRLLLRGNAGTLQGACSGIVIASCGLMLMTGPRLAPQAALAPWHAALIIVATLVLALTKIKPVRIIAIAAVLGLIVR